MSRRRYGARAGDPCPAGSHPLPRGWFPSQGCRGCLNERALSETAAFVAYVLPSAGEARARQALSAVTVGGNVCLHAERYRRVAAHLAEYPDALTSGASTTPIDIARLITELRRLGRVDVVDPRCADCGRPCFPRGRRPDGLRICTTCSGRRRYTPCGRCGKIRPVCRRLPDGTGLCQPCHQADPAGWEPCGRCGQQGSIRITVRGVRVGDCCYLKPHERCSVCGLGRAVSPYASGRATCADCATGPCGVCARCGLDAPTSEGAEPLCLRCQTGTNRPCRVCTTPTVSRDSNGQPQCPTCFTKQPRVCGDCGRQRVIARRASGGDPDRCASCWRGPTVVCDGCGRRRPCRGERAGRMLCKGCTPHPKRECVYCGQTRKVAVVWADGPACNSCYRRFMRAKDTCPGCGQHRRLLPYPGQPIAVCAPCAGAPPGPVCGHCGNEDWLYHKDRCARCVLVNRLTGLLGDTDSRDRLGLQPLFDVLATVERPESIISWTGPSAKGTAHALLASLGRGEIPLSHEALDALNTPGNGGTANHLDAILTAVGVLPRRDLELARLERAIPTALAAVTQDENRKVLGCYATWHLLRHARSTSRSSPLTAGARHSAIERLAAATHLLGWLASQGLDLAGCRQPDLDAYLVEHPTRRSSLYGFLAWTHRTRRSRKLTIISGSKPLPRTPAADDDQRWALVRSLLHDDSHTPADRVAGLLVLLFGQRPHRISRLTTDAINTDRDRVTITLGTSPIELPEPLAGHIKTLAATRRAKVAKRVTEPGPWLFPGQHPTGQPYPQPSPTGCNASASDPAATAPPRCCTLLANYHPPSLATYSDSAAPQSKSGPPSPPDHGPATSPTASLSNWPAMPRRRVSAPLGSANRSRAEENVPQSRQMRDDATVTSQEPATEPRGLYDGFEGYRTPTDEDYRSLLTQGMVVLDTNVLLNLYRYNTQTRTDLVAVLERLEDRLWVPHQVLVEFWRNRESALRDLQETGDNTVEALKDHCQQSINVLRTWANRVALSSERRSELQEHLEQGFVTVTEAINGFVAEEALSQALNTSNDPVLQTLEPVLKGRVGSPMNAEARAEAIKEALRRIGVGMPPGYKDKNKTDELAAGDYLVWKQLLDEAARRKRDVLLVTGDVKDDWWRKDRGQTRGPRPELVEELRRQVGVRLFMLRPESLLMHARDVLRVEVQEESVQDVERVDRVLSTGGSGGWTQEAVHELLSRLDVEAPVQAMAIRFAAGNDGFVSRDKVYELGAYDENRMPRGFTRPANRIAQDLRDRGIATDGAVDVLKAVYDPQFSYVQASGFQIPSELVPLIRDLPDSSGS